MKLHIHPASTSCRAVLMLIAEEALPVELRVVDVPGGAHLLPDFAALNPNRAVPVLEDGTFRLTESAAILRYLAEVAGLAAYPALPRARARVHELLDWFNTGFQREFLHGVVYPQVMPDRAWPHARLRALALTRAERGAARYLDVLDRHWLPLDGPYLGGVSPSIADFLGAAMVSTGDLIGFDLSPWPRIGAWMAAMRGRACWGAVNGAFEDWVARSRGARLAVAA